MPNTRLEVRREVSGNMFADISHGSFVALSKIFIENAKRTLGNDVAVAVVACSDNVYAPKNPFDPEAVRSLRAIPASKVMAKYNSAGELSPELFQQAQNVCVIVTPKETTSPKVEVQIFKHDTSKKILSLHV